jgi:hypothetical protein
MPATPTPNQLLQLSVLAIPQPQIVTFQFLPHRNRPVIDREDEHNLVPRRLHKNESRCGVPLPFQRDGLVRVVVSESNGGEESDGEVAAAGLKVFVAAADYFLELVGYGAGGGCGEE